MQAFFIIGTSPSHERCRNNLRNNCMNAKCCCVQDQDEKLNSHSVSIRSIWLYGSSLSNNFETNVCHIVNIVIRYMRIAFTFHFHRKEEITVGHQHV